jgi:geranylgeranyl diphosphate synthase, type I
LYEGSEHREREFAQQIRRGFEDALASHVRQLPSHRELVEYATRSGHRTRPVGCLLACAAVGGDWRVALDAAVAVELIHKSSVIRDDVVDGDETRSGQPAMHIAFGVPSAIAVSDLLWTVALRIIAWPDADRGGEECLRACTQALFEMASGQLEDTTPSPLASSVKVRLLAEERKTGALSELACRLGAIAGGGSESEVEALARYGRGLGTAFQIFNDVRNLKGAEAERSAASDVRRRRDTVLSAHARAVLDSEDRELLERVRHGPGELSQAEVDEVREVLISSGASEFGERLAGELMADARAQLLALEPSLASEIFRSLAEDALLNYAF